MSLFMNKIINKAEIICEGQNNKAWIIALTLLKLQNLVITAYKENELTILNKENLSVFKIIPH